MSNRNAIVFSKITQRNNVMRCLVFLFFLFFIIKTSFSNDKVLIISSYGSDYQWSNSIVEGITQKVGEFYPGIEFNVEFLSSEFIEDTGMWGEKMDVLLRNYQKKKLRAIILISDEAWMAYRDADLKHLEDIPLILCAVKPHSITTRDFVANMDSLSLSHFTPTQDVMKKYNATGVLREMNVPGYLSLAENLIKGMDRFVFITDNRFYGVYTRLLLLQEAGKRYPDIPVECIDARFVQTDSLLKRLPHIPSTAGVILTSWLTGEHGFEYSKDYIYSQMENKLTTPIFITNNIGLEKEYFVGGYFNEASFWGDETANLLIEIIRQKPARDIEPLVLHDDQCHIAWKIFEHYQLGFNKLPAKTGFYNQPEPFFVAYKYYIIGVVVALFIFILVYLFTLRSNIQLQKAQRLLLKSIDETRMANAELEKTHVDLVDALRKAEESDRLKSAFIANMSHEIRTPLNAIVGFSGVIADIDEKGERLEFAGHIQRNSDLLLQLISDILDISKIEAGMLALSNAPTDALDICVDAITSFRLKCKPGVELSLCEPLVPIPMHTDQDRVMQVIINLINNAIKFTSEGSVKLGYFSCDDNTVEFFVKDTGIGIAGHLTSAIFERFVKLNAYTEGTGLGLPICKTIVEMMGGKIGVESTVGVGSRFWFRIPKNGTGESNAAHI